jgi:FlaA1/EpsC-like NDP-sugar epimerase
MELEIVPLITDINSFRITLSLCLLLFYFYRFKFSRLYDLDIGFSYGRDMERIALAVMIAAILPVTASFFYRAYSFSRIILIAGSLLSFIFVFALHRLSHSVAHTMVKKGHWASRKLIVGTSSLAKKVYERFLNEPLLSVGILGFVNPYSAQKDSAGQNEEYCKQYPVLIPHDMILSDIEGLRDILINNQVDEVLFAVENASEEVIGRVIYECRKEKVLFELVPVFTNMLRGSISVDTVGGLSMLSFSDVAKTQFQRIAKRAFDFTCSIFITILLSPLMIVTAILIKLEVRVPVFFRQGG